MFPFRVQWSQFKNYFLFKLEKVMDDFRASAPDQRGPVNPNVESIPFEDMKERILKIVKGYNGWVPSKGNSMWLLLCMYSSAKECLFTYLCLWMSQMATGWRKTALWLNWLMGPAPVAGFCLNNCYNPLGQFWVNVYFPLIKNYLFCPSFR